MNPSQTVGWFDTAGPFSGRLNSIRVACPESGVGTHFPGGASRAGAAGLLAQRGRVRSDCSLVAPRNGRTQHAYDTGQSVRELLARDTRRTWRDNAAAREGPHAFQTQTRVTNTRSTCFVASGRRLALRSRTVIRTARQRYTLRVGFAGRLQSAEVILLRLPRFVNGRSSRPCLGVAGDDGQLVHPPARLEERRCHRLGRCRLRGPPRRHRSTRRDPSGGVGIQPVVIPPPGIR